MNQATMYRISTAIAVILILAGGVFLFSRRAGEGGQGATTTASPATTSSAFLPGAHTTSGVTGTGDFKVEAIPTLKTPDFRTAVAYDATLAPEVRAVIEKNVAALQAALEKNSTDLKAWLDLGAMRKTAGDYKGAEAAWRFVAQANPKNTAAFWNLGDLYTNFLKDYPKAETAYKNVVAIDPHNVEAYRELFNLYANLYKQGTGAADDILRQGIAANPDSVDLRVLLARSYKSVGRSADAKAVYDEAVAIATKQGNAALAAQLKAEAGE